ncbi:MAG: T9SS type A sorting domain-containing protein [Bacteroidales bacterium]
MNIKLQLGEDRSGRGGDHTPFRQKGYPAVRIISANEHGDGTGTPPDRNHTTNDVLGRDFDGDGKLDSLFVNPGYLARNTIMNGVSAAMLALGPDQPVMEVAPIDRGAVIRVEETGLEPDSYLVGIRMFKSRSVEFDTLFVRSAQAEIEIPLESGQRSNISVSAIKDGVPGPFSDEKEINLTSAGTIDTGQTIHLFQNYPNPWSTETNIRIETPPQFEERMAILRVSDLIGRTVLKTLIHLDNGETVVPLDSSALAPGTYLYSLEVTNHQTRTMMMVKN